MTQREEICHHQDEVDEEALSKEVVVYEDIPEVINGVTIEFAETVNRRVRKTMVDGLRHVIKTNLAPGHPLSRLWVSSANDSHNPPSRHTTGQAVDISRVNGNRMSTHYPSDASVKAITDALQNDFETYSLRRENFGPLFEKKNGVPYLVGGHDDHVHYSVN